MGAHELLVFADRVAVFFLLVVRIGIAKFGEPRILGIPVLAFDFAKLRLRLDPVVRLVLAHGPVVGALGVLGVVESRARRSAIAGGGCDCGQSEGQESGGDAHERSGTYSRLNATPRLSKCVPFVNPFAIPASSVLANGNWAPGARRRPRSVSTKITPLRDV